ncbi:MAG: hypothetical protein Q9164_000731 [Protoblastenia rupestris]
MTDFNDMHASATAEYEQTDTENTLSWTSSSNRHRESETGISSVATNRGTETTEDKLSEESADSDLPTPAPYKLKRKCSIAKSFLTTPQRPTVQNSIRVTPIRSLYNTFVYLTIGSTSNTRTFGIHKGLLCQNSAYFTAAFSGHFTEASTGQIALPEENPEVFDIIYTWLYTGKLTHPTSTNKDAPCVAAHFVNLFIFGDKYTMPRLCNEAINGIIHRYEHHNAIYHNLPNVYNNTLEGSALRRVMVAIYVNQPVAMAEFYARFKGNLGACSEFLIDVIKALSEGYDKFSKPGKVKARYITDRCRFHQHAERNSCV